MLGIYFRIYGNPAISMGGGDDDCKSYGNQDYYRFTRRSSKKAHTVHEIVAAVTAMMSRAKTA